MKILALSDQECPWLWDYLDRRRLEGIDLILSCGDLNPHYLSFLVTMGRMPLLYVHGNHDKVYEKVPPEGCECIEDKLVTVNGLRILGLGGSIWYGGTVHQYTEEQMAKRIQKLRFQLWRAGGVDIVLTHSPVKGYGDGKDRAHQGFQCLLDLIDKYQPSYLIHGHVHAEYVPALTRVRQRGSTSIINASERYLLEIPDEGLGR